jgi:hypothetical protein
VIQVRIVCINGVILNMNYCISGDQKVVAEVRDDNIVHIVTDNGSNYKKACRYLTNEYHHITW